MQWFLVAYGHAIRTEKAKLPADAMRQAYGMVDSDRMTLAAIPVIPRQMKVAEKTDIQRRLAIEHFNHTGEILSGYEKLPEIKNHGWQECQLCKRSIISEPPDDMDVCMECLQKVDSELAGPLSISQMREKFKIEVVRGKLRLVK